MLAVLMSLNSESLAGQVLQADQLQTVYVIQRMLGVVPIAGLQLHIVSNNPD